MRIFLTSLVSSTAFQGHWQKDSVRSSPHEHTHSHEHSGDLPHEHPHDDNRSVTAKPTHMDPGIDLSSPEVRQFYNIPPMMDSEEASYLLRTILSFKYYKRYASAMNHVRMQNFYALPESHRTLLQPEFTEKLQAIDEAIEKNAIIAKQIARLGEEMYLDGMEVRMGGPISPRQKYIPPFVGD
jgi:hypothetical protein